MYRYPQVLDGVAPTAERMPDRRSARVRARAVSNRRRRSLVRALRATARRATETDPIVRRRSVLLYDRAIAVRGELLETAAALERTPHPDPASLAALQKLLAGPGSPLFDQSIPAAEINLTLQRARARL